MRFLVLFLLATSLFFIQCKADQTADAGKNAVNKATEAVQNAASAKYSLTPFTESPSFGDAAISSMSYQEGIFDFGVAGTSYKLGVQTDDAASKMCANSAKGQHIHLIVDNGPYAAKYTSSFNHEIPDGEHHLLAFLSRSYHESIKTDAAHKAQKITVKNNSITASEDISVPMVFYSRPKGTYVGKKDTEKIMLDFYLKNCSMENGYRVKADINGESQILDSWQPYYIEGLPMGENKITLTLLNEKGNTVDSPLNPVTRTFTLKADPLEE